MHKFLPAGRLDHSQESDASFHSGLSRWILFQVLRVWARLTLVEKS
jgi:hypothetical protein